MRQVSVEFERCLNDDISCCLNEAFIVSDVTNILLSFGRSLRRGWIFSGVCEEDRYLLEESSRGQCAGILGSPDGEVRIPVYFRKNSLSVFAHVRKVKVKETEQSLVRAVYVKMQADVDSLKLGWQFLSNGNPVHKQHGKSFVDPSEALSTRVWKFRTTRSCLGGGRALKSFGQFVGVDSRHSCHFDSYYNPHFSPETC